MSGSEIKAGRVELIEFPVELPGFVFEKLKAEAAFRGINVEHLASLWLWEAIQSKADPIVEIELP